MWITDACFAEKQNGLAFLWRVCVMLCYLSMPKFGELRRRVCTVFFLHLRCYRAD